MIYVKFTYAQLSVSFPCCIILSCAVALINYARGARHAESRVPTRGK